MTSLFAHFITTLTFRRAARSDRGASLIEYGLLLALIAMVCLAAVTFLGESNSKSLDDTASTIGSAL